MNAVKPVPLATPDGVERNLRCTAGALKRISERFGTQDFRGVAAEKGDWVLLEVAYYMMFDERGQPPKDLSLEWLLENTPQDATREVLAAIIAAYSQGAQSKNEVEALLNDAEKLSEAERLQARLTELIGSSSKPLPASASDLNGKSSTGESHSLSLTPIQSAGSDGSASESGTPASLPQS